eukprot:127636_1
MPTNSRFAAVAADHEMEREREMKEREERRAERGYSDRGPPMDMDGPPPMPTNSRFAAAAADREIERERENRERDERRAERGYGDRGDRRPPMDNEGPPPVQANSRFAAAVAEREVEREGEERQREERRAEREQRFAERGGGRYGDDRGGDRGGFGDDRGNSGRFGGDRGGSGRFGNERGGSGRFGRGGGYGGQQHSEEFLEKTKTVFIRPELPKHLQPKKQEEPVLPTTQGILTLPGEDEEAAKARIEKKKRDEEEKRLAEQKAAEEAAAKKAAEEAAAAEKAAKAASIEDDLLKAFADGDKLGADLQKWCEEQGSLLPSVQKLVYSLLTRTQKDSPSTDCEWAEPEKYGAALVSLVGENTLSQVEVLWAIQDFCNDIGFPKVNDENLVQAIFRGMYKYDLADSDAFDVWKEDMSPEHDVGKGKAIIQTMDWFNWLEEDDEEDEEEDYEDYDEGY